MRFTSTNPNGLLAHQTKLVSKNRVVLVLGILGILGFVVSPQAGSNRNNVAVTTSPDTFKESMTHPENISGEASLPHPDDLSARGQELENTFYEIDAQPPYGAPTSMPASPANGASGANLEPSLMNKPWAMWAAGAAGAVGLTALGYLVLADDAPQAPHERLLTISDSDKK
jgi:hypothetical protein